MGAWTVNCVFCDRLTRGDLVAANDLAAAGRRVTLGCCAMRGTPLEPRNSKSGRATGFEPASAEASARQASDPLRPRRKNPRNWGQRETAAPRFS
jgi:hypothetical protein